METPCINKVILPYLILSYLILSSDLNRRLVDLWLALRWFFDCATVFTKSVAEVTFSLAYILDVAFVALYYI